MSRELIQKNHTNLVTVLRHVQGRTHDVDVETMARRMIDRLGGCTQSMLVGISADRGLPFVGYAKDRTFLYDLDRRKVAPIDRFYAKYVSADVTQVQRDKFVAHVTAAATHLGFVTSQTDAGCGCDY